MNIYTYVANSNPSMAKAICHKYGYKISGVQSKDDLGVCLEQLVAKEGESALVDIVNNHPDRDLIVEITDKQKPVVQENSLGFYGNVSYQMREQKRQYADFMNFMGDEMKTKETQSVNNTNMVAQTNTFLLASAFLLGVAIISRKI
jgi:hypothetical protein